MNSLKKDDMVSGMSDPTNQKISIEGVSEDQLNEQVEQLLD